MKPTIIIALALLLSACSATVPSVQQRLAGNQYEENREPSTTYDSGRF